jgi:hypothetical protein
MDAKTKNTLIGVGVVALGIYLWKRNKKKSAVAETVVAVKKPMPIEPADSSSFGGRARHSQADLRAMRDCKNPFTNRDGRRCCSTSDGTWCL